MNNNILLSPVYASFFSFSLSPYQTKLLFLHPFPVLTGGKYHKRKEGQDKSQHREILFLSWYIIRGSGVFGLLGSPRVVDSAIFPKESPAKAREIMRFSSCVCVCVSMCIRSGRSYLSSLSLYHHLSIPIQFFSVCVYFRLFKFTRHICVDTHTQIQIQKEEACLQSMRTCCPAERRRPLWFCLFMTRVGVFILVCCIASSHNTFGKMYISPYV